MTPAKLSRRIAAAVAGPILWFAAGCVQAQTPPAPSGVLPPSFTQLPSNNPAPVAPPSGDCGACGTIESIRQTTTKEAWTPLGMGVGVGGAPSGVDTPTAVTSFQIGPGLSNQGMVLLGAAGGASYRRSPNSYERPRWEVTIKLYGGGTRVVNLAYEPYVREGDHVRVSGNNVELLDQ